MRGLKGKNVLVTGGASGIGQATAGRFLDEGCAVCVLDRSAEARARVAEELPGLAAVLDADVAVMGQVREAFREAVDRMGSVDVLINNAGISIRHDFLDITQQEWDTVLGVNLTGVFNMAQTAARHMVDKGSGVILNTASTAGNTGYPHYADYSASKGGVIALTQAMALELAPVVRVNAISPGYVLTPMQRAEYSDEMLAAVNRKIPMGRHAKPEEIAALFAFLASEDAAFATGQVYVMDGAETTGGLCSQWAHEIAKRRSQRMKLAGKVALITGGTSGIGSATAVRFAAEGAKVAITGRNAERGGQVARDIEASGGEALFIRSDVRSAVDCRQAVELALERFGKIDVLFNNAGVFHPKAIPDCSEEEWDETIDSSLKGAFLMSKYVLPSMIERRSGSIIHTSSGWGIQGGDKAAAYCAAKGGLIVMAKAMAIDHGPQGIRVNCVCPGDVMTPMLPDDAAKRGMPWDDYAAGAAKRPLGRIGTAEEIAAAVLYLASDESSFVTGTALVVDGGGIAG